MTPRSSPSWSLPVTAFAQVWVAAVLVSPPREPGTPWAFGYAALSGIVSLAGLAVLAFAVRNCGRLWRVPPGQASWALVAASALVASVSLLVATGPVSIGVWDWESLMPGALGAYLIVVVVREVSRLLARGNDTSGSVRS